MSDFPEDAKTRAEQYLAAIAGAGGELPDEPMSRIEIYLAAIAGLGVELPEKPLTHIEQYLEYIALNGGGGGGGEYLLQSKTATPTKSNQSVRPDSGYYGLSRVTVQAIPDEYQDTTWIEAALKEV